MLCQVMSGYFKLCHVISGYELLSRLKSSRGRSGYDMLGQVAPGEL
jgi:hypothetical protein